MISIFYFDKNIELFIKQKELRREKRHTLFSHFLSNFFFPISYIRKDDPIPIKARPRNGQIAARKIQNKFYI